MLVTRIDWRVSYWLLRNTAPARGAWETGRSLMNKPAVQDEHRRLLEILWTYYDCFERCRTVLHLRSKRTRFGNEGAVRKISSYDRKL